MNTFLRSIHDNNTHKVKTQMKKDLVTLSEADINHMMEHFNVETLEELVNSICNVYINSLNDIIGNKKCLYFSKMYEDTFIEKQRKKIHEKFKLKLNVVSKITPKLLEELMNEYDVVWFNGELQNLIKENEYKIIVKMEGKQTFNTEGYCFGNVCEYAITIPRELLKLFKKGTRVAGQECIDRTDCIMRAMEHEMTHLIIFLFCRDSDLSDYHGNLFKSMVWNMFRHQDIYHEISP
jgi:hypothetical protein